MATLFLRRDLAQAWRGRDPFDAALAIEGETYRVAANRRTVRFETAGAAYFAKLHRGVGWREIWKNLAALKPPVLGARNEFAACQRLAAAGIRAPRVAAFGCRGVNPAQRQSFVVCDALTNHVSLETLVERWARQPPAPMLKRRLLLAVADLARAMHDAGVNHRDFYLCHLLADSAALARGEARLALIDLHRAQTRRRTPRRWRLRDLAALWFSAAGLRLSRAEQLRFAARYAQLPPREALRRDGALWRSAGKRARRLRWRELKRGPGGKPAAGNREGPASAAPAAHPRQAAATGERAVLAAEAAHPCAGPFRVTAAFENGAPADIECQQVLRHVPGRRLVARARIDDREVAAKFFFGKGAQRRCRKEARGLRLLAQALRSRENAKGSASVREAAAPALAAAGRCADGHWCAASWIAQARQATPADAEDLAALTARLHDSGLLQQDPHPGNFLVAAGRLYAVDSGAIRRRNLLAGLFRQTVGRRAGVANLARLLAALGASGDGVEQAWRRYCAARGQRANPASLKRMQAAVLRAARLRVRAYLRKIRRPCTEFAVARQPQGTVVVYARAAMGPPLEQLIENPDACMALGEPLKNGNTATVTRVRIGSDHFVVKRYNAKGRRAVQAWRYGHWLRLRGIPTARPLALLTRAASGPAYLVLEDLGDQRLDQHIARDGLDDATLEGVANLFAALAQERLAHRDAKASNFLVSGGTVALVDLDAMRPFWSSRAHRKDRQRFVRNWEGEVAARFAARLGVAE